MKKLTTHALRLFVVIAIAICPASLWAITGDVNGDHSVNAADVTALYKFILNGDTQYLETSDVNGDGSVNAADVTAVYRIILGTAVYDNEDDLFNRCYATLRSEQPIDETNPELCSFTRAMWQLNTITTDEAYCLWHDEGMHELNTNQWGSSLPHAKGLFYRLCANIDVCNAYLANAIKHDDVHNGEIRTLRALYHYYLMDLFGNVPYNTDAETPTLMAAQVPRATVYANLLSELRECEYMLKEPRTNTYGRIDKAAAWLLYARINLNQRVYAPSSQSIVVNIALAQAKEYAKKVIQSGYSLHTSPAGSNFNTFQDLFLGDNNTNGAQDEIIWPIVFDSNDSGDWQWHGTTFNIASCSNWDYEPYFPNGLDGQWGGILARPEFAFLFGVTASDDLLNSVTTNASNKYDNRALFFCLNGYPNEIIEEDMQFKKGFGYLKYLNMLSNGNNPRTTFASTDFPLMRFAEALLIFAEADARSNGGSCTAEGLQAVNQLQARANSSLYRSMTTNTLLKLWAKEFGFEGQRRTHLIRYDKYGTTKGGTPTYNWNWKGGSSEGRPFDKSKNIFPIPDDALNANSSLVQNPGYNVEYPLISLSLSSVSQLDGTVTECSLEWDPLTSNSYVIFPMYEIRVSDDIHFSTYKVLDRTEQTAYELDLDKLFTIAKSFNTSKLYFDVCTDANGTGFTHSDISSKDFHFNFNGEPWWIVGNCVGDGSWNNYYNPYDSNSMTPMIPVGNNTFEYAGYFDAGAEMKILSVPGDWRNCMYGGNENGGQQYSGNDFGGDNIRINTAGYYKMSLNSSTHVITWTKLSTPATYSAIGIIGEFSEWFNDVEMAKFTTFSGSICHDWKCNFSLSADSDLKFRPLGSWDYNWGTNEFPYGKGTNNGYNIPAKAGNYTVFFNDILGTYFFHSNN